MSIVPQTTMTKSQSLLKKKSVKGKAKLMKDQQFASSCKTAGR